MREKDFLKNIIATKTGVKESIRHSVLVKEKSRKGGLSMKKFAIITACIIVLVVGGVVAMSVYQPVSMPSTQLKGANYDEIFEVIEGFNKLENRFNFREYFSSIGFSANKAMSPESGDMDSAGSSNDYSQTNIQTEGMDEGDIVKNDGQYIYKLNTSGCTIVSANQGQMEVLSQISVDNYIPLELYIYQDKLVMIGGICEYAQGVYIDYGGPTMTNWFHYMPYTRTDIEIYNIADKSAPVLLRQLTIDGSYNTSRIMLDEGKLFYMVNYSFYYGQEERYIPHISDSEVNNGEKGKIPAKDIYYYDDVVNYSYLIIGNIDLTDPKEGEQSAYLGLGGIIYVSSLNIYVASYDYYSTVSTNIFGWVKNDRVRMPTTRIVKISLNDLKEKATTRVYGTIKDRYSLDEYEGHLRVATTVWSNGQYSMVYVLKPDLTVAGKIDNIAPDESIYSVRFNKEKGSLVTFEMVDPYFNLDLSDPANPKISKGLKEDGVSYYIHYIGEDNFTIGVGRDSKVTTTQWGERLEWLGLKISLYDNNSGEAENIKTITLEGQGYTNLFYDPKVLLYDEQRGLFAFAYEDWVQIDYWTYKRIQGLAVFRFDLDAESNEDKLIYAGLLTNLTAADEINNNDWYNTYLKYITRGVRIGDYIYTISDRYIVSYELDTLEEIDRIVNEKV